jgi:hypothetical protein
VQSAQADFVTFQLRFQPPDGSRRRASPPDLPKTINLPRDSRDGAGASIRGAHAVLRTCLLASSSAYGHSLGRHVPPHEYPQVSSAKQVPRQLSTSESQLMG